MLAPNLQAPVAQRWRIRYAKRGRLRFTSQRDFARALERALRRAQVPMAFSSGFSPHPRISYSGGTPTGVASEAEYLEIALAKEVDPTELLRVLDQALPQGLDLLDIVPVRTSDFTERLEVSLWRIETVGVPAGEVSNAIETFLASSEVIVERRTKNGIRSFDARGAVVRLTCQEGATSDPVGAIPGPSAILKAVVRQSTPAVRPDDVLAALRIVANLEFAVAPVVTREAQGPWDEVAGMVGDPFDLDRSDTA
jgi:radical SAM-linked protein